MVAIGHASGGEQERYPKWTPIFPPPPDAPHPDGSLLDPYDEYHTYTDATGRATHYIRRKEAPPGGRKKFAPLTYGVLQDTPRSPAVTGWHARALGIGAPLYGLHRLAARPDAPVLITEGEKACDAAQLLFPDHVCVTWAGGAGAVDRADFSVLRGRECVMWPDHDEPGLAAATAIAKLLPGLVALDVSDLPPGADAADVTPDDPAAWLAARMPAKKSVRWIVKGGMRPDLVPHRPWIVHGYIMRGAITIAVRRRLGRQRLPHVRVGVIPRAGRPVWKLQARSQIPRDDI